MLKNLILARLSVLLIISVAAVIVAGTLYAGTPKPKMVMVSAVAAADVDTSSGEVSIVTPDDSFARVHVSPNTSISRNGAVVAFDKIKRGYKITCKGNWDKNSGNIFNAAYVFIGGTVSDSDVTDRVAAACRKIANKGTAHGAYSANAQTARRSEKEPQLEITWSRYRQDGWLSWVELEWKNLTGRPMTQLTATVNYFTEDGKYIVSSTPQTPYAGLNESTGKIENWFNIRTRWVENEYPELPAKCTVEFYCVNQGDLRTSPAEVKLDAEPFRQE